MSELAIKPFRWRNKQVTDMAGIVAAFNRAKTAHEAKTLCRVIKESQLDELTAVTLVTKALGLVKLANFEKLAEWTELGHWLVGRPRTLDEAIQLGIDMANAYAEKQSAPKILRLGE